MKTTDSNPFMYFGSLVLLFAATGVMEMVLP